jgi:hypothetical protein
MDDENVVGLGEFASYNFCQGHVENPQQESLIDFPVLKASYSMFYDYNFFLDSSLRRTRY